MTSETKANILKQHQANALLNTPLPPQVMRNRRDLSADEMPSPLDERIIDGAAQALESGQTHYVDVPGIGPLREAVAEHLNSLTGTRYQPANILVTAGVQESRFLTIQKIGELYDVIVIPEAVHPGVRKALGVRARQITWLPVDLARGGLASVESIAAAARAGRRLFYLESPSRLSGATYTADEARAIHQIAVENEAGVIWDQGLAVWTAGSYASPAALESEIERIAVLGEAWPGMGLASWFIGCIAAPTDWIAPMQSQKQIMAICTSTAAQYAALEASRLYAQAHPERRRRLGDVKRELTALARDAGLDVIAGDAVNILALRLAGEAAESVMARIHDAGFAVADGSLFGMPGVARLQVGDSTAQVIGQMSQGAG